MLVDHWTKEKKVLSNKKYPELENLQKPMENNACSMVAMKKHYKTQQFHCFWLPDSSPDHEKLKKNNGFSMVTIKHHCKNNVFATFGPQNRLQNVSKSFLKTLQIRDPKKLSLCIYIYI